VQVKEFKLLTPAGLASGLPREFKTFHRYNRYGRTRASLHADQPTRKATWTKCFAAGGACGEGKAAFLSCAGVDLV
jgi:hypothetical protein